MAKTKMEKDLKLKITKRMDAELTTVAGLAGLFKNEIIRNGIRNELTRIKKQLQQTILLPEDYALVSRLAAERGVPIEQILSEFINHDGWRRILREKKHE